MTVRSKSRPEPGGKKRQGWRHFYRARNAELDYGRKLRRIARHIDDLVHAYDPRDPAQVRELQRLLRSYGHVLEPWARVTASRIVNEISRRDANAWARYANELGSELRSQLTEAPLGAALRAYAAEQVHLITSLPLEAAQRVHELSIGTIYSGARPEEVAREILRTGEVTRSRANLIARTETGRVMTGLTKIRAESVGSTHFRWLTAGDADVRKIHKALNGTVHRWDDPPVAGERGERALPGSIFNCRCVALPLLADEPLNWETER